MTKINVVILLVLFLVVYYTFTKVTTIKLQGAWLAGYGSGVEFRTQSYVNWMFFCKVNGWESTTVLGPLERRGNWEKLFLIDPSE
jgi:hypothetical protein